MVANNHILVDDEVKDKLDKMKIHKRETYNDILKRVLIKIGRFKNGK